MKTLKLIFFATSIIFVACNDSQKEMAQNKVTGYENYVDSISAVAADKAYDNWKDIETAFKEKKTETHNAIVTLKEHSDLQNAIDESTLKYETFKAEVIANHERMEIEKSKNMMRKSLLGTSYDDGDMKFTWVNKDNILSVYQNFVDTVDKNKDSYSREDWDEIKLLYEAIDTRKNTVEKEGLTSSDNRKIAGLKLKFAPMYTINRMGAKSEENAKAKK
mgnify:CR=1 FL=1|tara:strand:- start:1978 stop:2634 length:657 start_codon:yes stop_codon:yes gene_type:complete